MLRQSLISESHKIFEDYQPKTQSWRDHVMKTSDILDPIEKG